MNGELLFSKVEISKNVGNQTATTQGIDQPCIQALLNERFYEFTMSLSGAIYADQLHINQGFLGREASLLWSFPNTLARLINLQLICTYNNIYYPKSAWSYKDGDSQWAHSAEKCGALCLCRFMQLISYDKPVQRFHWPKCNWLAPIIVMRCVMGHAWRHNLQRFRLGWTYCYSLCCETVSLTS
mgnify:CR=1 FL=1